MATNIKDIHDQVFDFLYRKKSEDDLFFMTRKNNNKGRLDKGYWFRGDNNYLATSFWSTDSGPDSIYSISFIIRFNVESCLYLSAHNKEEYNFFKRVASNIDGLNEVKDKDGEWEKIYKGTDYLTHLKLFLLNEKPLIDKLIFKYKPTGVSILDKKQNKHIMKINNFRNKLFGDKNRIARVCWNSNGWKYPSGLTGKKLEDRENGFGLEEWLFDDDEIVGGYKYGYLKPVERIKDRKATYNISLYSIHSSGIRYYIGEIINAE
ncbi:MAG: hypothetical protein ACOCRO_06720, partial [Halanaerobiales bacterium]